MTEPDERPKAPGADDPFRGLRAVGRWGTVGVEFAAGIALFTWIGVWADGRLGTDPWLTLVGALLGIGGAMLLLVRRALAEPKDELERNRDRSDR